ncbi:1658_t:CDS:1, partial [Racocetra persica]
IVKRATTNKSTYDDVIKYGLVLITLSIQVIINDTLNNRVLKILGPKVKWVRHGRWVVDGKFYTSAG